MKIITESTITVEMTREEARALFEVSGNIVETKATRDLLSITSEQIILLQNMYDALGEVLL